MVASGLYCSASEVVRDALRFMEGRDRSDLVRGIRSYPVGTYLIFDRKARAGVEVTRVLSGFRDVPPLFRPG